MSARELLSGHLDDFVLLSAYLLTNLVKYNPDTGTIPKFMQKITRKYQLLQQAVDNLVGHYEFQQRIIAVKHEIQQIDDNIIHFAAQLGDLEQKLHDAITDETTLKNLDGIVTKQSFSVHEVTVFGERLGKMSAAPADFLERNGMSVCRPPAPLEDLLHHSRLHHSIAELQLQANQLDASVQQPPAAVASTTTVAAASAALTTVSTTPSPLDVAATKFVAPAGWKPGDAIAPEHELKPSSALDSRKRPATSLSLALNPDLESSSESESDSDDDDDDGHDKKKTASGDDDDDKQFQPIK